MTQAQWTRRLWPLIVVLATLIAGYAVTMLVAPSAGPPFILERLQVMPWVVRGHFGGGAVALAIGAWQLNGRLRDSYPIIHRWAGRLYVAAVGIGGVAGLLLATKSEAGIIAHLGFGALALAWLATTTLGFVAIRGGDTTTHRRWMIRSYALTFAAVNLRISLPIALTLGAAFPDAYRVIAWSCWIPNLLVAEWWLRRQADDSLAVSGAARSSVVS